jgi:hypothetical protein
MALLAVAKVLAGRTDTPEEPLEELDPALFDANDWNGLGLLGMALMEREYASRRMEFASVDVIAVYPDFKKRTIRIDMRRMLPGEVSEDLVRAHHSANFRVHPRLQQIMAQKQMEQALLRFKTLSKE